MTVSLATAIERTEQSFDKQIAKALDRAELVLADRGATADEIANFQAQYAAELEAWKVACMTEIVRELSEDAPSGKLQ